jgi:hypothetical protein
MNYKVISLFLVLVFVETNGNTQNIEKSTFVWKACLAPVFTDPNDDFAMDPSVLYVLYNLYQ